MSCEFIPCAAPNRLELLRNGWREVATAMTGGKPYFYFRPGSPGMGREWISWNRVSRQWEHQIETISNDVAMTG